MTSHLKLALSVMLATFLALPGLAQDAQEPAGEDAAQEQAESTPEAAESDPETAGSPPEGVETPEAEAEQPEASGEVAGEEAAGGPVVLDEEEGSVLDDQTFEGEDDDFIPTEQIQIDQAIPFPTDI
ncbi:MAG TPA: hypothetical protein VHG33_06390 [Woeseiaceae bacterium]|nr:hypothetical protein [Woeseiaceae bacterium]